MIDFDFKKELKDLSKRTMRELIKTRFRTTIFDNDMYKLQVIKHDDHIVVLKLSIKSITALISLFSILGTIATIVLNLYIL